MGLRRHLTAAASVPGGKQLQRKCPGYDYHPVAVCVNLSCEDMVWLELLGV